MSWIAHYFDPKLNASALTRPCTTKEDALRLACDLMYRQCRVECIQGPDDVKVRAVEIADWCKARARCLREDGSDAALCAYMAAVTKLRSDRCGSLCFGIIR
jgi:hypothetical protein